jgi:hypothetical protein
MTPCGKIDTGSLPWLKQELCWPAGQAGRAALARDGNLMIAMRAWRWWRIVRALIETTG